MSNYSRAQIEAFATRELAKLLPLDGDSVQQLVGYAIMHLKTREALYGHFSNLLGESPETFDFVTRFGDMLFGEATPEPDTGADEEIKPKRAGTKSVTLVSTNGARSKILRKKVVNKTPSGKPAPSQQRLKANPQGSRGVTTSEMFDMTPKKKEKAEQAQRAHTRETKKTLSNIAEIEEVLSRIEVMNSQNNEGDVRVCNCNATRHPLFELYPNCLNCGKIICEKEGAQPCSFCGKPLMSEEERAEVVGELMREKDDLEAAAAAAAAGGGAVSTQTSTRPRNRKNVMKISLNNLGQNNFKVQEQFFKRVSEKGEAERMLAAEREEERREAAENEREMAYWNAQKGKDPELLKAEDRLETLLSFQDEGTERTKIIDNAADFEAPTQSLWASPLERALQLKRQQKTAQNYESRERQRTGRGDHKIDVVIKDGKAIIRRSEVSEELQDLSDDEEIRELKAELAEARKTQVDPDVAPFYDASVVAQEYVKPVYLGEAVGAKSQEESPQDPLRPVVQTSPEEAEEALFAMVGV